MLKNRTIRLLLVLNVLVLVGLGTRLLINLRAVHAAQERGTDAYVARNVARGVLGEKDQRRVFEIARSAKAKGSVTDDELGELLQMPDRSPAHSAGSRDVAGMNALGALIEVKSFTPAQTLQLASFIRRSLDDAERAPLSAGLAVRFAFRLRGRFTTPGV